MSVPYYIGAKQILERLAYKSPKMLTKLVERDGLPVHKRVKKTRTGAVVCLAISESMVSAWELVKGQEYVRTTRARRVAKNEARAHALTT